MPRLRVSPDGGKPYPFPLSASRITIGRSPSSDLVLDDKCCSSRHAEVFPTADGYAIQDLNSKNGTSVNGEFIRQKTELRVNDVIRIGSTVLRVERDPAKGETEQTATTRDRSGTVVKEVTDVLNLSPLPHGPVPPGRRATPPPTAREREDAAIIEELNQSLIYTDGQLDRYLDRIMDAIIRHIPMDRGILMLEEESTGKLEPRVTKLPGPMGNAAGLPISQSIVRLAFEKNQAVLIPDTQQQQPFRDAESIIKADIHSAMCAPLFDCRDIIGVIYADRISRCDPFDEADLRRLIFLANRAAEKIQLDRQRRAIEAARRVDEEIKRARIFLHNLLPRADPDFEPFDISGRAETSPTVGGDYFDYIPLGSSHLGIAIADVAGTGLGASLQMTWLSGNLWAEARSLRDLGELSAWLSESVFSRTQPNEFISFFMGVVDRDTGEMTYVNAGHNYPLLLGPAGETRELASTGMCLGMFSRASYETRTVTILPGQVLCLYTDGIVEHMNSAREQFGETRLIETLLSSTRLPARDLVGRVYDAVREFSPGTVPDDDMTLVVLKRKAG
jgi:sigma-B regulation protein RsbU (phosphoserine phosphatase)